MVQLQRRRLLAAMGAAAAAASLPQRAWSAQWPDKPVNIIVPFPPGGPVDVTARFVAMPMGQRWGQPAIVDNKAGAGGIVGAQAAARMAPDGYGLFMAAIHHTVLPSLRNDLTYDITKDFVPVGLAASFPIILVVHPSVPVTDFASFVAWAKAQGEPVSFGSGGQASVGHIVGELLAQQAGLKMQHVPYKGAGPMRSDVLGGQIKVAVDALPQNIALMKSGRLRVLAVTAPQRVAQAPDVPSVVELGLPALVAQNFVGISAPAGLPAAVEQRLVAALKEVLALPDLQAKLRAQGFELGARTPDEFAAFIRTQAERWAPVVRRSGARL